MQYQHRFDLIIHYYICVCDLVATYKLSFLESLGHYGEDLGKEFVETALHLLLREWLLVEGFRTNHHLD